MGEGIRVVPDDTGKYVDITANVRIPQFCGFMRCVPGQTYNVPNYVPGSQVYVVADSFGTMSIDMGMRGRPYKGWTYRAMAAQSLWVGNGQFRFEYAPDSAPMSIATVDGWGTFGGITCWVFQVHPVSPNNGLNYGIKLINASNLMSIENIGLTLRPIWRGTVAFNGVWEFPQIGGFDRNNYIVFAHWNNTNCGLTRNTGLLSISGNPQLVSMAPDQSGRYNGAGTAINSGNVEVVIFYPMMPETTPCGINIFNEAHQCTWSTKYTPFLLKGQISLSTGWSNPVAGVQRAMIPVSCGGFHYTGPNGLYQQYGVRSNGNQFIVTAVTSGYTTTGSPPFTVINSSVLPVIDAADYI